MAEVHHHPSILFFIVKLLALPHMPHFSSIYVVAVMHYMTLIVLVKFAIVSKFT